MRQNRPNLRSGILFRRFGGLVPRQIEVPRPHLGGFQRHCQVLLRCDQLIVRFLQLARPFAHQRFQAIGCLLSFV
jgi:hypothetical protein